MSLPDLVCWKGRGGGGGKERGEAEGGEVEERGGGGGGRGGGGEGKKGEGEGEMEGRWRGGRQSVIQHTRTGSSSCAVLTGRPCCFSNWRIAVCTLFFSSKSCSQLIS